MRIADFSKTLEDDILLSEILNKPRQFLISHSSDQLTVNQAKKYKELKQKLEQGRPLAYLIGYRWFFGEKFKVNLEVLIPRPETENLVNLALEEMSKKRFSTVLEIGTGSGAIAISIKKNSSAHVIASDLSIKALKIARQNAKAILRHKQIVFKRSDLLSSFEHLPSEFLLVANLPYLSKKQLQEPSIVHEPKLALFGGRDPARLLKKLLRQLAKYKFQRASFILELDPSQAVKMQTFAKNIFPAYKIAIKKDLNKRKRFLIGSSGGTN